MALFLFWNGIGKDDSVISSIFFTHFHNSQYMSHFNCVIGLNGSSIFIPREKKIPGISTSWGFAFTWNNALHLFPRVTILFLGKGNQGTSQGPWHGLPLWLPPKIPCRYQKQQKVFLKENKNYYSHKCQPIVSGRLVYYFILREESRPKAQCLNSEIPHATLLFSLSKCTPQAYWLLKPQFKCFLFCKAVSKCPRDAWVFLLLCSYDILYIVHHVP